MDKSLLSYYTRLILNTFHKSTKGALGEKLVAAMLNSRGYSARKQREKCQGDLEVIDLTTGELIRVEVKTATADRRGNYQFILKKSDRYGGTDCKHADFVVCLCVTRSGSCALFVFDAEGLNQKSLAICANPFSYSGRYVRNRQYFTNLELRKNVRIS